MRELEVADYYSLVLPNQPQAYVIFQHDACASEDRAVGVFTGTVDQAEEICRLLHDDFPDFDGRYFAVPAPLNPTAQQLISELHDEVEEDE